MTSLSPRSVSSPAPFFRRTAVIVLATKRLVAPALSVIGRDLVHPLSGRAVDDRLVGRSSREVHAVGDSSLEGVSTRPERPVSAHVFHLDSNAVYRYVGLI
jgi:hypothetical protein